MSTVKPHGQRAVYTIGHSNHTVETVIALLRQHGVDVVVDVRSAPYSRFAPHFNRREVERALLAAGFRYLFMGKQLGGRPDDESLYDERGHAVYSRVEKSPLFHEGLQRVQRGIVSYRVALMCTEEDPAGCHRHLLIGHVLAAKGVTVLHIRGDGSIQPYDQVESVDHNATHNGQLPLFGSEEVRERKSIRSVLPKQGRRTSSER